ncbi:mapk-regulated corepressor-interacting protein 1 isoform X3 [Podarcis raffonei]|uniref:mapk-regulated corepressor-interacting protein 1 isoform X3 n=1 Tax=Podarcis raffonei TaxID=65483 RepID=UPI0023298038|nr:mapk-regulated corepressor-interacting protein 1 isoform X3 [Podarcis raffonei]
METSSLGYSVQGLPGPIRPQCARAARPRRSLPPRAWQQREKPGLNPGPAPPSHTSRTWARAGKEAAMTRSVSCFLSHWGLHCTFSSPVSRVVYNGKRNSSPRSPSNSSEIFTPAHEENVRFISEGAVFTFEKADLFSCCISTDMAVCGAGSPQSDGKW